MTDEYPPAFDGAARGRHRVDDSIKVIHSSDGVIPGIHLIIEERTYFIPRAEARRIARHILFHDHE